MKEEKGTLPFFFLLSKNKFEYNYLIIWIILIILFCEIPNLFYNYGLDINKLLYLQSSYV